MNEGEKIKWKVALKNEAEKILQKRIDHSENAMNEAQSAANSADKSSAGDKYETARAVALNDRDIHAMQLEAAKKDLNFVHQIDVGVLRQEVEPGVLAKTDNDIYFFLTGLGPIELTNETVIYLSLSSPLGRAFAGKKKGEKVIFNNKEFLLEDVF